MAYDDKLERRIDALAADWQLTKKKMFGSMAYFLDGTMLFAVRNDELLFRVAPEDAGVMPDKPGIRQAVMGERVMKNWFQAGGQAIDGEAALRRLMEQCRDTVIKQDWKPGRQKGMPL